MPACADDQQSIAKERSSNARWLWYGFDPDLTDEQILEKLLALNIERANDETKSAAKQNAKKISRMKSEHEMI